MPQETQIGALAAEGHSSPRIGSQLLISHRTVAYSLHEVFCKLEITNRAQRHAALSRQPNAS
jgi:DNA-binding NarL/FixJ family response regulator